MKKDLLNGSIKVDFYKRKFQLFSKFCGSAFIPLKCLQGNLSATGTAVSPYKGEDMHLHVELILTVSSN